MHSICYSKSLREHNRKCLCIQLQWSNLPKHCQSPSCLTKWSWYHLLYSTICLNVQHWNTCLNTISYFKLSMLTPHISALRSPSLSSHLCLNVSFSTVTFPPTITLWVNCVHGSSTKERRESAFVIAVLGPMQHTLGARIFLDFTSKPALWYFKVVFRYFHLGAI